MTLLNMTLIKSCNIVTIVMLCQQEIKFNNITDFLEF